MGALQFWRPAGRAYTGDTPLIIGGGEGRGGDAHPKTDGVEFQTDGVNAASASAQLSLLYWEGRSISAQVFFFRVDRPRCRAQSWQLSAVRKIRGQCGRVDIMYVYITTSCTLTGVYYVH